MSAGALRDHADPEMIDTAGMELDPTLLVFDYLHGLPLTALRDAPDPIGPSGPQLRSTAAPSSTREGSTRRYSPTGRTSTSSSA